MKPAVKLAFVAGATALLVAISGGEAEAKPVVSSWYGPRFEGSVTASGEVYEAGVYTAAHPSLPFGTDLLVTYGGQRVFVE